MKIDAHNPQEEFVAWLQRSAPKIYHKVLLVRPDLLTTHVTHTLGAVTAPPVATTWASDLKSVIDQVAKPLIGVYQEKKLIDINIERAKAGLAPINSTAIAPTVNVGLAPQQAAEANKIGKMMLIGLGIVALLLFLRKK